MLTIALLYKSATQRKYKSSYKAGLKKYIAYNKKAPARQQAPVLNIEINTCYFYWMIFTFCVAVCLPLVTVTKYKPAGAFTRFTSTEEDFIVFATALL